MIELSNVTKRYGGAVTAVDALSFTVKEGEIFGLIGTSGCGKTTTLRMINRLEEPTSGSITVDGMPVQSGPPEQLRRRIGYVIQNMGLFPHYSVQENIAITPHLLDCEAGRVDKRCRELLELVGLDAAQFAHRKPEALSGGQQQRVGLARALAADPPLILMDEPFGALDPITKEHIQKEFKKLLREIKKTIVLVTHDVFEAFDLCDRLCLMNEGRARQIGTPRELLFQPADDFVRSFFDNHRFQLEMMSVTIGDLVNNFKSPPSEGERFEAAIAESNQGDDNKEEIFASDSFFSVIENAPADAAYRITDDSGVTVGRINADQLLEGFQQVRRRLREGVND